MMISSGIDIVAIDKMELSARFIQWVLSNDETILFHTKKSSIAQKTFLAGRWAVKEAIFKASSLALAFNQINIIYNSNNQPEWENAPVICALSISHHENFAVAVCFLKKIP